MGHRPPKDVQEAAQRAERWIEEGSAEDFPHCLREALDQLRRLTGAVPTRTSESSA